MNRPPTYYNALGLTLIKQGRFEEAVASLQQALHDKPGYAEAHNNLGNALAGLGRWEDAAAAYRASIRCRPGYAKAWSNLGEVLLRRGETDKAEAACRQAIQLDSEFAPAHNNLGNALRYLKRFRESKASYEAAIRRIPNYALAHCNLGIVLCELGQLTEAEEQLQRALQLEPQLAGAYCALGNVQLERDKFAEAAACFEQTIRLAPDFSRAWNDLALTLQYLGRLPEALSYYRRALDVCPDDEFVRQNYARALLLGGDYPAGWQFFECGPEDCPSGASPLAYDGWDGSPLCGRTILLHADQGVGDVIQFVRFAASIPREDRQARAESREGEAPAEPHSGLSAGGRILLACRPALVPLLKTCDGIDEVVSNDDVLPAADIEAPLLRLPAILGTTFDTIPFSDPYLIARDDLQAKWRERLGEVEGFRVGIAWQGNPKFSDDRRRSIPLASFQPLSEVAGVRLFSLQKGFGTEQLAKIEFPVVDLGSCLDEQTGAFEDTAAVMTQLDLVISSDTSIVHVAGALSVPVWVALAFLPDWRFLLGREDSPWYPTMRLFRQESPGDWNGVFERIADQLRRVVVSHG